MKGVQQGRLIASNGEWMICIKYRQLNYLSNAKQEHNKLNESNLLQHNLPFTFEPLACSKLRVTNISCINKGIK